MKRFLVLTIAAMLISLFSVAVYAYEDGTFYTYANFPDSGVFRGGNDVDGCGNRLYVNNHGTIDYYDVALHDSDGDGVPEPDQHPDNPDATGPMEARTLTYVGSYTGLSIGGYSQAEIFTDDPTHLYYLGGPGNDGDVYRYNMTTGVESKIIDSDSQYMAQLGYDNVNDKWFAMNEYNYTVYSWSGTSWVSEFDFPPSDGGSHPDGLEVVTDPDTVIPYVYVSEMTNDYLQQWYDDSTSGWTYKTRFAYSGGGSGDDVEGMGFGPIGHFWATGWSNLYEIGGGSLGGYIPPEPEPVIPEPSTIVLLGIGLLSLVGLSRRKFKK
jgi:hypothetical protein